MTNNHSADPFAHRSRCITPSLRNAIDEHPVIVLSGARQVEKSTLLQHESPFPRWRFNTYDNLDALRKAEREPTTIWADADRIILHRLRRFSLFSLPSNTLLINSAQHADAETPRT